MPQPALANLDQTEEAPHQPAEVSAMAKPMTNGSVKQLAEASVTATAREVAPQPAKAPRYPPSPSSLQAAAADARRA
jgi:hypothetical protein